MFNDQFYSLHFSVKELKIEESRIFHLLGFETQQVTEPYLSFVRNELSAVENISGICGGVRMCNSVFLDKGKKQLVVENLTFQIGSKLTTYYHNVTSLAFIICTAGEEISNRSKEFSAKGELLEAYVADVIGSVIVEAVADNLHQILKDEYKSEGKGITNRYSPGHCDWKVNEQFQLFLLFPEKYCGITLNESMLMIPVKSVSGMIGIGEGVVERSSVCRDCDSKVCIYRKN